MAELGDLSGAPSLVPVEAARGRKRGQSTPSLTVVIDWR